jgi:hypothetical protein
MPRAGREPRLSTFTVSELHPRRVTEAGVATTWGLKGGVGEPRSVGRIDHLIVAARRICPADTLARYRPAVHNFPSRSGA